MKKRTVMSVIMVFSLSLFSGTAYADDDSLNEPAQQELISSSVPFEVSQTFENLDKYLSSDKVLDFSSASEDPLIDEETLIEFAAGLIVGGSTVEHLGGFEKLVTGKAADFAKLVTTTQRASCEGKNGWKAYWPTVYLNSCYASLLSNAMYGGAAIATLAGFLVSWTGVGGVIAIAIATSLGVGGALSGICNSWGRGIEIYFNPAIPMIPLCWSQ